MKGIYACFPVDTSGQLTPCLSCESCYMPLVYLLNIKDSAAGIRS